MFICHILVIRSGPSHPHTLNLLLETAVGEAEDRRSTIIRTMY
jgi:hypothetical protein